MYKKLLLIFLSLFIGILFVYGQALETGAGIGAMNYLGDLSPKLHLTFFRPGIQVNARWNFNNISTLKLNLLYGFITASDDKLGDLYYTKRNLSFLSQVLEASLQFEYNFLAFKNGKDCWHYSPFVFAGFGMFYFSPDAKLEGDWIALQALGTEGQTTDSTMKIYSKFEACIPMGIGFKYSLNYKTNIIFEFGVRKTFTDYLDDVSDDYFNNSAFANTTTKKLADRTYEINGYNNFTNPPGTQRGNKNTDDWYLFTGISVSYVFYWVKCPGFMY